MLREDRLVHEDLVTSVEALRTMTSLGGAERNAPAGYREESTRRGSGVFRKGEPVDETAPLERAIGGQ